MEEQSQNPSESIIVGNCLSCQGLVRVPSTAPAKSRVRCPHCSESYSLFEILDQAVPELEVIDEPKIEVEIPRVEQVLIKTEHDGEDRPKFVVPPQLSKGARRSKRRNRSSDLMGSQDRKFESGEMKSGAHDNSDNVSHRSGRRTTGSDRSRSKYRSSSKSSRHQRNTLFELLKVVLGGLLAIPIAYLLVFWFFKQDPLNVGPKLGNVVPFLVPSEFRGDPINDLDNESERQKKLRTR